MATTLRITSFNVENLFNRYAFLDVPWDNRDYEQFVQAIDVVSIASQQGDLVSYPITEIQRNNTAMAILDAQPDILAVQEIENIYTLRNFNDIYLDNYFGQIISLDGNDFRGIDVGLLIKRDIKKGKQGLKNVEVLNIRTHIDDAKKGGIVTRRYIGNIGGSRGYLASGATFSRDCLEVDLKIETTGGTKVLTFMVNHLKARDRNKQQSDNRRKLQAERVAELVHAAAGAGKLPIVLGDMNADARKSKTIDALVKHGKLQDPFTGSLLPGKKPEDTWTHYYDSDRTVSRLDYILPHKNLKAVKIDPSDNSSIVRKGLTTKCKQYPGTRYATIGPMHTEASDHCPTTVVLEV